MKKALPILLAALLILLLSLPAFAISSADYTFRITSDGANEITVETGAVITVTYTISSSASADHASHAIASQNEIYYDSSFFQFVPRSATVISGFTESEHTRLNGDHLVYYNTSNSRYYNENGTQIGTFKLKVIATSGSSTVQNTGVSVRTDGNEACNVAVKDLIVNVAGSDSVAVTEMTLNTAAASVKVGASVQLRAEIVPSNATNQNVAWASSNERVATVDGGVVTAKAEGTAIITATTADGGKTATCTVTVTAENAGESASNPFRDVKAGEYYYDAVLWAADNGITQGTSATTFSPNAPVTRGQVVTFLWRAAGCPQPTGSGAKFADVVPGSYYEKAVAWAVGQGITNGTTTATFSPDRVCTRGQIVTFLARFAGVKDAQTATTFTDVKPTDYFAAAVQWAKDNGVTSGSGTATFSPNQDCTRAQVVTFLYRWMVR